MVRCDSVKPRSRVTHLGSSWKTSPRAPSCAAAFSKLDSLKSLHKLVEILMEVQNTPPSDAPALESNVRLHTYRLLCSSH
jgi:hypothetical protein